MATLTLRSQLAARSSLRPRVWLRWSPDGEFLAAPFSDRGIAVWRFSDDELVTVPRSHREDAYCLSRAPNGKRLAVGTSTGEILIWEVSTGTLASRVQAHDGSVVRLRRDAIETGEGMASRCFTKAGRPVLSC